MAAITSAGLGSGIDVELLVSTLSDAERRPVESRLDLRETQIQSSLTAFGTLRGSINDLKKSLTGLTRERDVAVRQAVSSKPEVFTATANNTAVPASASVRVEQLAQAHKLVSSAGYADLDTAVGAGTLTLSVGDDSFSVTITGGVNNTLAGIRDAINEASDNPGVTASVLKVDDPDNPGEKISKLVLTANESGMSNALKVQVTDDADGNNTDDVGLSQLAYDPDALVEQMSELSEARDAQIYVDDFLVTSSTNVFENVIQGVTLNAVSADPGETYQLNVNVDKASVEKKLQDFVTAYNEFLTGFKFLTDFDPAENEAGLLTGDSTARTIMSQIQRTLGTVLSDGVDGMNSLSQIGIQIKKDGKGLLELDTAKLSSALNENFDAVGNLIAGTDGVLKSLDGTLDSFSGTGGLIANRNATYQNQLEDIAEQREALNLRIESVEKRLRQQFTAMDILVAQFKNTGDFITQQMESLKPSSK